MTRGTKQSQDVIIRNSNFTAKFTDGTLPLASMTDGVALESVLESAWLWDAASTVTDRVRDIQRVYTRSRCLMPDLRGRGLPNHKGLYSLKDLSKAAKRGRTRRCMTLWSQWLYLKSVHVYIDLLWIQNISRLSNGSQSHQRTSTWRTYSGAFLDFLELPPAKGFSKPASSLRQGAGATSGTSGLADSTRLVPDFTA